MQAPSKQLYQYPLHLIFHPFNGYWELKYERNQRTTLLIACMIMLLLTVTKILHAQYSGFLINFNNPKYLNSLLEVLYVMIPVLFWCGQLVANDPDGRRRQVFGDFYIDVFCTGAASPDSFPVDLAESRHFRAGDSLLLFLQCTCCGLDGVSVICRQHDRSSVHTG